MVDNRSAGALGISGGINFKSGDISGTAAKTADDRASQGTEYFMQEGPEQSEQERFVDRSMQLRASLNSLALINLATVLRNNRKNFLFESSLDKRDNDEKPDVVSPVDEKDDEKKNKKNKK